MTDHKVYFTSKLKLNYRDLYDLVRSMMKTKQDNDVTDHIGVVYAENETKLSWLIGSGVICEEDQTR